MGGVGCFLWIRNLAQPNAILAIATGILSIATSLLGPRLCTGCRGFVARVGHVNFRVEISVGHSVYWTASTAVNGLQGLFEPKQCPGVPHRCESGEPHQIGLIGHVPLRSVNEDWRSVGRFRKSLE